LSAETPDGGRRGNSVRRPSGRAVFALSFLVFFGASAIWSAATPLLAAPDEPSQMVKAAAVAHGEWTAVCYQSATDANSCVANTTSALGFEVLPSFYDMIRAPDSTDPPHSQICFHTRPADPASCARSLNRTATPTEVQDGLTKYVWTYQARYPPLYYAIVGLPSHFGGSTIDLYLMRLVSAALAALFLALSLWALSKYSRNRLLLLGLVVAVTPMVLFLGGVVNSSGLEIACGVALFSSGAVLVTERLEDAPAGLVAVLVASASTLELVRSLSPLWVALSAVALVGFAKGAALGRLLRRRFVLLGGLLVVACGAAAIVWIVAVHATDVYTGAAAGIPSSTGEAAILRTSFLHNAFYLPDMVGIFGWFDTRAPAVTYLIWYALAIGLAAVGVVLGGRRRGGVLVAMALAILVVPVLISSSQARQHGYVWSGRDTLPFAVGLPLLAAAAAGRPLLERFGAARLRRLMVVVAVLAGVAQFLAFYEALRRYAVGTAGPIFGFLLHPSWHPAIGIVPALVLEFLALVALYGMLVALFGAGPGPDAEPARVAPRELVGTGLTPERPEPATASR